MNAVANKTDNRAMQAPNQEERRYTAPDVDIYETKDVYVLKADMPGVTKDGLALTLDGNTLTIEGSRSDAPPKGQWAYRETQPVNYRRVFELDPVIDTARISARVDQGVLSLELPKAEKVKPRRIEVTG
jgi:HSP20 family protein